jgi:hypothetical protein
MTATDKPTDATSNAEKLFGMISPGNRKERATPEGSVARFSWLEDRRLGLT